MRKLTPEEQELVYKIEKRIDRFADLMKSQMRANLHKGDWDDTLPAKTMLQAVSATGDLANDLMGGSVGGEMGTMTRCVNLANYAFILADVLTGHLFSEPEDKLELDPDEESE